MKESKSYHILKTIPNDMSDEVFMNACKKERLKDAIICLFTIVLCSCDFLCVSILISEKIIALSVVSFFILSAPVYVIAVCVYRICRLLLELKQGKMGYLLTGIRIPDFTAATLSKLLEWNNFRIYEVRFNVDTTKRFSSICTWQVYIEDMKTKEKTEMKLPLRKRSMLFQVKHDEKFNLSFPDGIIDFSAPAFTLPYENTRRYPIIYL